jgi:hypothetical protein
VGCTTPHHTIKKINQLQKCYENLIPGRILRNDLSEGIWKDWIGLAQDRYRWKALGNSVMNLQVA